MCFMCYIILFSWFICIWIFIDMFLGIVLNLCVVFNIVMLYVVLFVDLCKDRFGLNYGWFEVLMICWIFMKLYCGFECNWVGSIFVMFV